VGATTVRWIAKTAQTKAGYAATSVIRKPEMTLQGTATVATAVATDIQPGTRRRATR
jgi:hypothetical protein